MALYKKIKGILDATPGLTQKGLAEHMGLDPAAVNRMLHGRRFIMAEEIPLIESYIGRRLDLSAGDGFAEAPRDAKSRAGFAESAATGLEHVPVFTVAERKGDPVDWTQRHPAQAGTRDAFAIYVPDDEMAPRYFAGELVYLHPHRPPVPMQDVAILLATGRTIVRRMVSSENGELTVQSFHPPVQDKVTRADLRAVYAIVGRG